MKTLILSILLLGTAAFCPSPASAALLVSTSVQGRVTGTVSASEIEVDGRLFHIDQRSEARYAWKKIERGDVVVLTLNGIATNPDTKVVAINVQSR